MIDGEKLLSICSAFGIEVAKEVEINQKMITEVKKWLEEEKQYLPENDCYVYSKTIVERIQKILEMENEKL